MDSNTSTKKLRVLHVAKWYPNRSDVQNGVFVQKHIACTAMFAEVKVLAWLAGKGKTQVVESIENGLPITRVYFNPKTTVSYKRSAFREYIRGHYNNKNLPDIIHLHIFSPDLLLVVNWAKKRKIPVVISEHWSGYARGVFAALPGWRKWAYRKLGKVNRVLPVSAFLQESMLENNVLGNFTVVPNVVDFNPHQPKKLPQFTFLVVADFIDEIKNISGIINAFAEVFAANQTCQLHVVGGGPDEELIADLVAQSPAKQNIKLIGRLPNEEVLKLMPACHILVNNSRAESFGVVILEAHAAGIPVISTLCGGPNEWLEDEDYAIAVNDQKALVTAMKEALSRTAHNYVFTKHLRCAAKNVAMQFQSIYNEVLNDSNTAKTGRSLKRGVHFLV